MLASASFYMQVFSCFRSVSLLSFFTRRRDRDSEAIYNIIKHEYNLLGKMRYFFLNLNFAHFRCFIELLNAPFGNSSILLGDEVLTLSFWPIVIQLC